VEFYRANGFALIPGQARRLFVRSQQHCEGTGAKITRQCDLRSPQLLYFITRSALGHTQPRPAYSRQVLVADAHLRRLLALRYRYIHT
jgi:hypothetical protein